jgi:hypothetical protein
LTLLDCRGREIAELASPEARTQFPVALEQMGPWLPRLTVALEDRRSTNTAALTGAPPLPRAHGICDRGKLFRGIHDHPATRETREQP